MSKMVKGFLIVACVLMGSGLVIGGIGSLLGGNRDLRESLGISYDILQRWDRNQDIWLDEESLDIHIAEDIDRTWEETAEDMDMDEELSWSVNGKSGNKKVALGSEIKELEIEFGAVDLRLEESDNEYFQIISNTIEPYTYQVDEGELKLKGLVPKVGNKQSNYVVLYIPKDFHFQEVDIKINAGVVEIYEILADEFDLKMDAGLSEITYLNSKNMELEVQAGRVEIKDGLADKANFRVNTGEIIFVGNILKEGKAKCNLGTVDILLADRFEDYNFEVESTVGETNIGDRYSIGIVRDEAYDNGANRMIKVECGTGSIDVNFMK